MIGVIQSMISVVKTAVRLRPLPPEIGAVTQKTFID